MVTAGADTSFSIKCASVAVTSLSCDLTALLPTSDPDEEQAVAETCNHGKNSGSHEDYRAGPHQNVIHGLSLMIATESSVERLNHSARHARQQPIKSKVRHLHYRRRKHLVARRWNWDQISSAKAYSNRPAKHVFRSSARVKWRPSIDGISGLSLLLSRGSSPRRHNHFCPNSKCQRWRLALRLLDRRTFTVSQLRFTIPDARRIFITAIALICWSRGPVFGIRFFGMHEDSGKAYAEWLSSMAWSKPEHQRNPYTPSSGLT